MSEHIPYRDRDAGGEGPPAERSDVGGSSPPVAPEPAEGAAADRPEASPREGSGQESPSGPVATSGELRDSAYEDHLRSSAGLQDEAPAERVEPPVPEGVSSPPPMPTVDVPEGTPRGRGRSRRSVRDRTLATAEEAARSTRAMTAEQRLLTLDAWQKSGLPAKDFGGLVGVSAQTLYAWRRRFAEHGPAGLVERARGRRATGSRLPEATKRAILMLKEANPSWGCQRISDVLYRGPGLPASASAVSRVLKDAGYESGPEASEPHPDRVRRFERAVPGQLWQTDLFTFILKRQNRRVYLVVFMDDHSRYIVSYGLHGAQTADFVLETLREGIASHGPPQEILTDNGTQYVTWRGTSKFAKELRKLGIGHVVARPRHPQTLGKVERFWGTLWRECLESAVFADASDARARIGHFVDWYNFRRPHQGIDGLVPADRFYASGSQVKQTLAARVSANALELARHGEPKVPFYVTGQLHGRPFSVHAEGERMVMVDGSGERKEVDLAAPPPPEPTPESAPESAPETSVAAEMPRPIASPGDEPASSSAEEVTDDA